MKIDYQITMDHEEARERIRALGDYLNNRHGIAVRWEDENRATFRGRYLVVRFEGEMILDDGVARFRGKDPGMLWRRKAKDYVFKKMRMYLDPNTPLETLPRR